MSNSTKDDKEIIEELKQKISWMEENFKEIGCEKCVNCDEYVLPEDMMKCSECETRMCYVDACNGGFVEDMNDIFICWKHDE